MGNVTLTETARPLRILSIIEDWNSLSWAIRLNTHLWGGAGNVLLPVPDSEKDRRLLKAAVKRTEPDIVYISDKSVSADLARFLNQYPAPIQELSSKTVRGIESNRDPLRMAGGTLQHIATTLNNLDFPEGQEIYHLPPDRLEPSLQLFFGHPSVDYLEFLDEKFQLYELPSAKGVSKIEGAYLSNFTMTPWKLTLQDVDRRSQWTFSRRGRTCLSTPRSDHATSLHLFIDDGNLDLATTFWNNRRVNSASNKYLVPADDVIPSIKLLTKKLYTSEIDELIVFRDTSRRSASGLLGRLKQALDDLDIRCPIAVYHSGFEYSLGRGHPSGRITRSYTVGVEADGAVRFNPDPPGQHARKKAIFGVDVEVEKEDGSNLSLPSTDRAATLLMNSLSRIKRARDDDQGAGQLWLRRTPPVRPIEDGIAVVTKVGDECTFYLHDASDIVEFLLDEDNIDMKESPETRYATGVLNRLDGLSSSLSFIRDGGILILKTMYHYRDKDGGRQLAEIWGRMADDFSVDTSEAEQIVKNHMPVLLRAGLVDRGVNLRCDSCGLEAWYNIDSLDETVRCKGCHENFQLSGKFLRYAFSLNQLAARFIEEGGRAVLKGAASIKSIDPSATIQFGGYLTRHSETDPFAEIDIFVVSRNALAVAECKDYYRLGSDRIAEIIDATDKLVRTASELGLGEALLVVATEDDTGDLLSQLGQWHEGASEHDVGLTTIVNDDVYLEDMEGPYAARKVQFVGEELGRPEPENRVGNLESHLRIGPSLGTFDHEWMRDRLAGLRGD